MSDGVFYKKLQETLEKHHPPKTQARTKSEGDVSARVPAAQRPFSTYAGFTSSLARSLPVLTEEPDDDDEDLSDVHVVAGRLAAADAVPRAAPARRPRTSTPARRSSRTASSSPATSSGSRTPSSRTATSPR